MEQKLINKVCALADVSAKELPQDAESFLRAHARVWVTQRRVVDRDVQDAARELCSRFSVKRRAASVEPHFQAERRPTELAPLRADSVQEGATTSDKAAFLKWPPRPQVLHRMQRLAADKTFQEAIARENAELEEQKKLAVEQTWQKKEFTRREMIAQEQQRQAAIEREKQERERNRASVLQFIYETKEAEHDAAQKRHSRCLAERSAVEAQRVAQLARQEKAKQQKRLENDKSRRQLEEELAQVKAVEKERAAVMKQSLVDFLNEGLSILRQKDAQPKKCDALPETRVSAKEEILAQRDRRILERKKALDARRQLVCAQFTEQTAKTTQQQAEEDERTSEAAELINLRHQQRLEKEVRDKFATRKVLVASLEDEISHQRIRRKGEEDEKLHLREAMNAEAHVEQQRQAAERCKVLEVQRERRRVMDQQLEQRVQLMLTPSPV